MNQVLVKKYTIQDKDIWNEFIAESKNGTFMFNRNYMDYHSDRYEDFSLMFYEGNILIAVFPASNHGDEIRSHGGLTYGGFVYNRTMKTQKVLQIMDALISFCKQSKKKTIVYKRVPYIYFNYPSDEDLYALFRCGAKISRRDISTAILLSDRIAFNERRRRNVKKAIKAGLVFKESRDFKQYMDILSEVLATRHNARPVHTSEEIELLSNLFPNNIKLYASFDENKMLAGTIIYETGLVAHAQYIASSSEGRDCGALDYVFNNLINDVYADKTYFDFGTSNENRGLFLNEGLIEQKQEFGGRGVAYDEYTIDLRQ